MAVRPPYPPPAPPEHQKSSFVVTTAPAADAADGPPPKPFLDLGCVVRNHHINFQENRTTLSVV